jgi:UDP-N-acetylglucosamine 2-epimerase (non-hydrolysing)
VRIVTVFGTRPEAIKLAPVIEELKRRPEDFQSVVAVTAQHRALLDQVLDLFGIVPDHDLDIMTVGQSLTDITLNALRGLTPLMERVQPDAVIVQGDTTTTFAAALAAFYHGVPVGHVEAGLRTHDLARPFPEEGNRQLATRITRWHFPPTSTAEANLLAEGIDAAAIHVTGNTVVDALLQMRDKPYSFSDGRVADVLTSARRIVLVTAHRRENWGEPFKDICHAVAEIVARFDDVHVLFATHPNPIVADVAHALLGRLERVDLIGPQEYLPFVKLMDAATLILSDSGGVQEEAPTLGKPALVLRNVTERPEAIDAGVVRLVGTDRERIVAEASRLLGDPDAYSEMAQASNPFGDGCAAQRIVDVLAAASREGA